MPPMAALRPASLSYPGAGMRTATRSHATTRSTRNLGTGRRTARLPGRMPPRGGSGARRTRKQSVLLGVLSIVAFCLFWVLLLVAASSAMHAVAQENARRLAAAAGLGLFSFLMPIVGTVLGTVGVILRSSHKVVAGIGLALNALLLLWLLANLFSRH